MEDGKTDQMGLIHAVRAKFLKFFLARREKSGRAID
jgi:hypothetical protein